MAAALLASEKGWDSAADCRCGTAEYQRKIRGFMNELGLGEA